MPKITSRLSQRGVGSSHPSRSLASWLTCPHDPPPASSAFPPCLTLVSDTFMLLCTHFFSPESPSVFSTGRRPYSASLTAQQVKNLLALQGTRVPPLSREEALEEEVATHSSVLAWKIPWTEEPDGLQSISSVHFSLSVVSNSLQPLGPQHTRPPCPSPTPKVYPNSRPLSR